MSLDYEVVVQQDNYGGTIFSMTKRVVIYTRISKDESGEGQSNQRQEKACRSLADARGWEVVEVCEDIAISAYNEDKERPGWKRVLFLIESASVDVVLAWHVDRMTRSLTALEGLIVLAEKSGTGIATVNGDIDLTNDTGRMVARILAAVARAEVERKSARQVLAHEQRAGRGEPWAAGTRPFGYEEDHVTIRESEAKLVRDAADRVLAGVSTYRIARDWTEAGMLSAYAGYERKSDHAVREWSQSSVKNLLLNPRYVGWSTYKGEVVATGRWEPVLDESTHYALKMKLNDPGRRRNPKAGGNRPRNLLSGLSVCDVCGSGVSAGTLRGKLIYTCSSRAGCVTCPREPADDWVSAAMVSRLSHPDLLVALSDGVGGGSVDDARVELPLLRGRLVSQMEMHADGLISDAELMTGSRRLRESIERCETLIGESDKAVGVLVADACVDPERWWGEASLEDRRAVVMALVEQIVVKRGLVGRKQAPIGDRISVVLKGVDIEKTQPSND